MDDDGVDDVGWFATMGIIALLVGILIATVVLFAPTCRSNDKGAIAGSFLIRGCR